MVGHAAVHGLLCCVWYQETLADGQFRAAESTFTLPNLGPRCMVVNGTNHKGLKMKQSHLDGFVNPLDAKRG
eukprot:15343763-Ditylum_brightwellii.AAC.1